MTSTTKIAIIGAGGFVFPFRLIGDLLSFPALRNAELCLMDVKPDKLAPVADATRKLVAHHGFDTRVVETTDRRAALTGADFVIITFQVGGVESYRWDVEIPRRYGVDQTVGDTVGPGGVFRFLRTVPAYRVLERPRSEDRRPVSQRARDHEDAGPHTGRPVRGGELRLRRNQPPGVGTDLPSRRRGSLPTAAGGDDRAARRRPGRRGPARRRRRPQ